MTVVARRNAPRAANALRAANAPRAADAPPASPLAPADPTWYRDAIVYEVHIRAFADSNGDGQGDFRGLTSRLDYLHDLGVTALWILPFYPSPLRDDGYDIADYTAVNPAYGTLRDVVTMIREAHKRGIKIITELVCNHTSDQHPWFQRARRASPGSSARDFYVWSDTPDRYPDARIIFGDFETSNWAWDPVAGAYYWHRFYSHQPDLNFDNPRVEAALTKAVDFWLDRGVDGLRLDAVPYLYERDGTDCENLPETHAFLRRLRRHVDERYGDRLLLAEANQWPEDAAAYFGQGDECHMAFNFPVMPRMFMAIQMEDRLPIVDIVEQTPPLPDEAQWALFLRNHDELTLEMVTDEERDYMYRAYATDPQARVNLGIRRRLAPLLGNHRRRIELMNGLLFSLPGTPFIYYGDEIGMGDNVNLGDRDGVRTPMQWASDHNSGFSTAPRDQLYLPLITDPGYHYEVVNVAVQQANPHSLLWWMKRLIALRKRHPAFARGSLELLHPENRHVLAFLRRLDDETILVVANLSRFFQPVELNLSQLEGARPVEMFGRVEFPLVGRLPYLLTLGPHEFLWFTLETTGPETALTAGSGLTAGSTVGSTAGSTVDSTASAGSVAAGSAVVGSDAGGPIAGLPRLAAGGIGEVMAGTGDRKLIPVLLRWIAGQAWYKGRWRKIQTGEIVDRIPIDLRPGNALILTVRVDYDEGESDRYLLPVAEELAGPESRGEAIAAFAGEGPRLLVEVAADPRLTAALARVTAGRRQIRGRRGVLTGRLQPGVRAPRTREVAQSDGPNRGGDEDLILDLRHGFEPGEDPEAEVMQLLASHDTRWAPRIYGELGYTLPNETGKVDGVVALLRQRIPHQGDLVEPTRDAFLRFTQDALASARPDQPALPGATEMLRVAREGLPNRAVELVGPYVEVARSIGSRIGELHLALASAPGDPRFSPEPFTRLYQDSLFQSIDSLALRTIRTLRERPRLAPAAHDGGAPDDHHALSAPTPEEVQRILSLRPRLRARLGPLLERRFTGARMRIHGALRLTDIMRGDRGLVIVDFEGDTRRPLSERRLKRSALRDLTSTIRSFGEVTRGLLREADPGAGIRPEDAASASVWAGWWRLWVSASLIRGYRETTDAAPFLPVSDDEWASLLDAFLIQEALGGLSDALRTDPDGVAVAVREVLDLVDFAGR